MGDKKIKIRETRKAFLFEYLIAFLGIATLVYISVTGMSFPNAGYYIVGLMVISSILIPEMIIGWSYCTVDLEYFTVKTGIFSRKEDRYHMSTITDVDYEQSAWQRMLGYGTIVIRSFSHAGGEIEIGSINKPEKVATKIGDLLHKYLTQRRIG